MYVKPSIESSYEPNDLGRTLYDKIIELKPKIVIDFGVLHGYSTVAMAQAMRDLHNGGKILAWDMFNKYPYKHAVKEKLEKQIKSHKLTPYVEVMDMNFFDWIKNPSEFDVLHLDISNDGDVIDLLWEKFKDTGKTIFFEGGSLRRDKVGWMTMYNKKPINKSKAQFTVIDHLFPSISKLNT